MRAERRAVFVEGPPRGEAEHLIAAAVGEDRTSPSDEPVQPSAARDQLVAGPQIEVVRIAEKDLGAERFEIAVRDRFDRALGANGHERRRLHVAVRRRHHAAARAAVAVRDAEGEGHHKNATTVDTEVARRARFFSTMGRVLRLCPCPPC